jgi:3D (Asp-Asp-Asp) domain-containing protein
MRFNVIFRTIIASPLVMIPGTTIRRIEDIIGTIKSAKVDIWLKKIAQEE